MYPFFCFQASSLTTPVLAHQQPGKRPLLFISLPIICFCFLSFHGMEITAKGQSHSFEGKWEMGNRVQGSLKGPHYCKFHCDVHHCFFLLFRPCLFVFAFYSTSPPTNQPTPSFTLALASGREHELDELEEFAKERTKKKRKKRGSREENVPTDMVDRICPVSALDLYIYNVILYARFMSVSIILWGWIF